MSFAISPSGDMLVFNAVGEGGRDLFLLDPKTSRVTRIAATPDYEVDPVFSPDGKSVAYAAGQPGDRADHIFLRTLDGKSATQLTAGGTNDASPTFSPDGSLIAFTRDKTYNWGGLAANWDAGGVLCVMKANGSGLRELTKGDAMAIDPRFSPDGKTILFRGVEGNFTVAVDGSRPPRSIGAPGWTNATFSPDGQSVAFSMGRFSPDQKIYLARAEGTEARLVTRRGMGSGPRLDDGCSQPAFAPDGKRLLFFAESWPKGATGEPKVAIWEIDLEGNDPRQIADYGLFDDPLRWNPGPPAPPR